MFSVRNEINLYVSGVVHVEHNTSLSKWLISSSFPLKFYLKFLLSMNSFVPHLFYI